MTCGGDNLPIAPDGCRYCTECPDGFENQIAQCAIDALCAESPDHPDCPTSI